MREITIRFRVTRDEEIAYEAFAEHDQRTISSWFRWLAARRLQKGANDERCAPVWARIEELRKLERLKEGGES